MSVVQRLKPEEPVGLDRDQLEDVIHQLGQAGAARMVNRALEDLAATLARASKHYRSGRIENLRASLKAMIALARPVGMTTLARVARDVRELSRTDDAAAFGAAMARLERIGESSLMAVLDLQDLSG